MFDLKKLDQSIFSQFNAAGSDKLLPPFREVLYALPRGKKRRYGYPDVANGGNFVG